MRPRTIRTPHGPARAHLHGAEDPTAVLVLGHGAGGGIAAPDLVGVATAAVARAISVVLVEQPYRVAGRRSPAPAAQLDAAWTVPSPRSVRENRSRPALSSTSDARTGRSWQAMRSQR